MKGLSVSQMADRIADLMGRRLGVRGRGLADKLRHGAGKLPREVRAKTEMLAEADIMAMNPRLYSRIDHEGIERAYLACERYFSHLPGRRGRLLQETLASIALSLLGVGALVFMILIWRGFF